MRQDLRVRRTHKLLWEALLALLDKKDFDSVSVREICDTALVHRTTFYQHYEDKYDLLRQGVAGLVDELLQNRPEPVEAVKDFSLEKAASLFVPILKHAERHRGLYRAILGREGGSAVALLRKHLVEQTSARLELLVRAGVQPAVPLPLLAHFGGQTILSLLAWWIENNLPCSAEEMARHIILLVTQGAYGALALNPGMFVRNAS